MIRNTIIAAALGTLATYLPFWQWDGALDQIVGAMALGIVAFAGLLATEKEEKKQWESPKYR